MMKGVADDPMLSPINHNNNHVDTFPQHTYATHKLPSFIEMISSQKSRNSTPNAPTEFPIDNIKHVNSELHTSIESNDTYTSEDESAHAIDLSKTSGSLVINGEKTIHKNGTESSENTTNDRDQLSNDSQISQYIAKNPNLTYKGSGDIMNMDIIFENVSIEEDMSIGNDTRADSTESLIQEIKATQEPQTVAEISDPQVENVNIGGVQYQIITLENSNVKDEQVCNDNESSIENAAINIVDDLNGPIEAVQEVASIENVIDTIPVISQESLSENYVLNSDEVVIMSCSSFNVATEVETVDEISDENRWPAASNKSEPQPAVPESNNTEIKNIKSPIAVKIESAPSAAVQNRDSSANDRKRKRKVVPLLANNKRTRRNNTDKISECQTKPPSTNQRVSMTIETAQSIEPSASASSDNHSIPDNSSQMDNPEEAVSKIEVGTPDRSFMDSLVVVESEDPKDPTKTIHEVYIVDPDTNEMSDKPLDLPDDVIQKIRMSMS